MQCVEVRLIIVVLMLFSVIRVSLGRDELYLRSPKNQSAWKPNKTFHKLQLNKHFFIFFWDLLWDDRKQKKKKRIIFFEKEKDRKLGKFKLQYYI